MGEILSSGKLPSNANSRPAEGLADLWVRYPTWTAVQAWGLPMASPPAEGTLTGFAPGAPGGSRAKQAREAPPPSRPCLRPRPSLRPARTAGRTSARPRPGVGPALPPISPASWPRPSPRGCGLGITHDACARWASWRCRSYGRRSPRGRAALPGWGAATGSAWPPGAMAALAVVFLFLWAASWPSASASGEEFWPGQSAADILSGAASRRR